MNRTERHETQVKRATLMQSLSWHCEFFKSELGLDEAQIADVLAHLADWYADRPLRIDVVLPADGPRLELRVG